MEKLYDLKCPLQLLIVHNSKCPTQGKACLGKFININKMNELCYLYYVYSVLI